MYIFNLARTQLMSVCISLIVSLSTRSFLNEMVPSQYFNNTASKRPNFVKFEALSASEILLLNSLPPRLQHRFQNITCQAEQA